MKYLGHICAVILGGSFIFESTLFLFKLVQLSPDAPAGYLTLTKTLDLIGGLFLLIPISRRIGLLVVGPTLVSALTFHIFFIIQEGSFEPMMLVRIVTSLILVWLDREKFINFIK